MPQTENSTTLLPGQDEFRAALHQAVQGAVRAVIESVRQEELAELLQAGVYHRNADRKGYRNGSYPRDLVTASGVLTQLRVPRDRAGQYQTQVFERFQR